MKRVHALKACLTICLIFVCATHAFSQDAIRIGFLYVFSGRLAHYGFGARQGAELAMEEINNS
ncbi:MAG TPA: hypothetical protein VK463_20645, partial [Desulfomonilaceae bacterium]|nr:hypothetical protein [Desulfomonilaceae bacterium]